MMAKALETSCHKRPPSGDSIAIPLRPGAAGRISLIRPWSRGAMVPLVALLEQPELAASLLAPAEGTRRKAARPVILMAPTGSGGAGRKADRKADLVRTIETALLSGRGVILLGASPADLPEDLQPFLDIDLRLPPPDRALIVALLRLLCPDRPDPVPPAALPGDAALARLTPVQLSVACRGPIAQRDPARIVGQLHRLTTPRATGQGDAAGGLSAVEGQEEAVAILRRLAADIGSWRAGALDWRTLPRGVLLEGPPGVGKTLLAQALAVEAGLPLISLSFAECQKAGHLGDTLAALDARVAEAEARASVVVFLDEIDGFSSRMGADHGRHSSYMGAVITGLLQQIDRLLAVEGVVLIAATNAPEAIDPAIRRAGRFDTRLTLAAPTRAGHAAILTRHLGLTVDICDADPALACAIADTSRRLVGRSGAEAAALARAARSTARAEGLTLPEALTRAADAALPEVTATDRRRIALHEAGHVVVALLSGLPAPTAIRICPEGGQTLWPAPVLQTAGTARATLCMLLAGRAAESLFLEAPSSGAGEGPGSDLARATRLARQIETEWALGDGDLLWHPALPAGLPPDPTLRPRLAQHLARAEAEATALLDAHRPEVEAIADCLEVEGELTGEALSAALAPLVSAAMAERPHLPRQAATDLTLGAKATLG